MKTKARGALYFLLFLFVFFIAPIVYAQSGGFETLECPATGEQVNPGEVFNIAGSFNYEFPIQTYVVIEVFEAEAMPIDLQDELLGSEEFKLSGEGTQTFNITLTAPPEETTWELVAMMSYYDGADWNSIDEQKCIVRVATELMTKGPGFLSWRYITVAASCGLFVAILLLLIWRSRTRKKKGGKKDPCKDPAYVQQEKDKCKAALDEMQPVIDSLMKRFNNCTKQWDMVAANVNRQNAVCDAKISVCNYLAGVQKGIEDKAEVVVKVGNIVKAGVKEGVEKAAKEGWKKGSAAAFEKTLEEVEKNAKDEIKKAARDKAMKAAGLEKDLGKVVKAFEAVSSVWDDAMKDVGIFIAGCLTGEFPLQEARNLRRSLQEFLRETKHFNSTRHIKEQLLKEDYLDEEYVRKMDDPYREDELINLNDILDSIQALIGQIDQKLATINASLECIKCQDLPEYKQLMDKLTQMMRTVRNRKAAFSNLFDQTVQTLTDAQKIFDNDDLYEQGKTDWEYRNRLKMEDPSGKRLGKKK